ncbi:RNA-directed DNA polymerase [Erythrobacter colymbi]|uniref:RNA-directed DNA polymerase n=1 Tax=Erythrobacter colymbi TaxID=1161202 RepID=UPI0013905698|nr:RNA-directed DNA polymerase [Erythrobacter colymbi]
MALKISQFASLHTPRLAERRKKLEVAFSTAAMEKVWKDYVRPGLRSQEVLDLFDYNDFHWNKSAHFEHLAQALIDGRYRPLPSHPHRLEKRLGVCRTVVLPSPQDAVVLQCLSEVILPRALKKQPSKNAFFSRSHSGPAAEFTFGTDYIWFKRWPEFSKKRTALSSTHEYVVTTDISNFYDNIKYSDLRNLLSDLGRVSEVLLDILFDVIDRISWRPDYLPSMWAGLPQVQFDAPRLLAHVYLFEVDGFLDAETGGCFVRWVDDITFAVSSKQQGKRLLRDVDALLQLRGLRLNSGKTAILSKDQARRYFHARSNEFLDRVKIRVDKALAAGSATGSISRQLRKSFDAFRLRPAYGHSDKVLKRYVSTFGRLRDPHALGFCISRFVDDPGFRETALRYYNQIGPYPSIIESLSKFLKSNDVLDDASICQVARCLTLFEISSRTRAFKDLSQLGIDISKSKYLRKSYFYLVASLWLLAKYGTQNQLKTVLQDTEDLWSKSEFLSRQVAASAAKFRKLNDFNWIANKIAKHGFQSAITVVNSLRDLQTYTVSVPAYILLYCTNGNQVSPYSIQRFLVTFRVASSRNLAPAKRTEFIDRVLQYVRDPHFVKVLQKLR